MWQKLRKGGEIILYMALEIIHLIDMNVNKISWKEKYYCHNIREATKKKGKIAM